MLRRSELLYVLLRVGSMWKIVPRHTSHVPREAKTPLASGVWRLGSQESGEPVHATCHCVESRNTVPVK